MACPLAGVVEVAANDSSGNVGNAGGFFARVLSFDFLARNLRSILGLPSEVLTKEERVVTKLLHRKGSELRERCTGGVFVIAFIPELAELVTLILSTKV